MAHWIAWVNHERALPIWNHDQLRAHDRSAESEWKYVQDVSGNISGLTTHTTYHFRIVATNSAGTRFGSDQDLTTP